MAGPLRTGSTGCGAQLSTRQLMKLCFKQEKSSERAIETRHSDLSKRTRASIHRLDKRGTDPSRRSMFMITCAQTMSP